MFKIVIVVCTHVYLLNTFAMEFLIWVPLILMQSIIVKGTPQSFGSTKKTKNNDRAISESEVIETVVSKFGGPRISAIVLHRDHKNLI
ncbi:hypothetical protein H5410_009974 [Solanum commersonii]|uniref:Uncharacterized protein n=1 Tax=Solanum commersonii TaxID=4109 RepID=A0A9J6AKA0_SOLCO|nr:hypothetical protein H5410_009974 [Solanum commersonii]